jgi:P4 family phage/plasmid primase-like protien
MMELPQALSALGQCRQFVTYKVVPSSTRPGKSDKFPTDWRTGDVVSAHDPQHWADATTAAATATARGQGHGVGFVFTDNDPFWFIDIDDCLLPDGSGWSPVAVEMCTAFAGAAIEVSQSGKGLHIFGTGTVPPHGCKNIPLGLEMYHTGRFVALTGTHASGDASKDFSHVLPGVIAKYFPPSTTNSNTDAGIAWSEGPDSDWCGPEDDDILIQRMLRSHSVSNAFGGKASFADLWTANTTALAASYPDPLRPYDASSADMALAQHLAFWTGRDCERIRRLMLKSSLVRDKWERDDYLVRTITGACGRQVEVLKDKPKPAAPAAPPGHAMTITTQSAGTLSLDNVEMSLLQVGTEDAVAKIFTKQMVGRMLYNHTRQVWLEWEGTRWRVERTQKALDFARDLARSVNYEGKAGMGSNKFCSGVEKLARADRAMATEGIEFDADNYTLNTPGGTFDLMTNTLRPHSPDDKLCMCTAVAPTSIGGDEFLKFVDEITVGDAQLAEFLQVSLGACLSGAVESHWMLFWIGAGRNGKNTLGDLVQDALGDYARKVPTSTLMAKAHEAHPTEIANLQGIRLAMSSEINDGEHWNEARINEVTGDATLSARYMRGDLFTFRRTHKHLVYGNHRPQLRTLGAGIQSRIKIVPFRASFLGREDHDLPRRLRANLGFVLGWLIDGHRKWLAAGKRLPKCEAVERESSDYFNAQSTVEMWLGERVDIDHTDDRRVLDLPKAGDLYKDYVEWKKARGEVPVSMTRWSESLRIYPKTQSSGVRYRCLKLRPKFDLIP